MVSLGVRELFIRSYQPPDLSTEVDPGSCSITVSALPYNHDEKRLMVILRLESGIEAKESEVPYAMRIELIGLFEVDETRFKVEHLEDWAKRGAPIVMFPFLREQAFGLSLRCGFKPLMLPLIEVPTFKTEKPKKKSRTR
jgi:preprotein translocase subunit SecB